MADFQISEEDHTFIANLIGKPYLKNCTDGHKFDCWTLTKHIYEHFGIILPNTSVDLWNLRALNNQIDSNISLWEKVPYNKRQFLDVVLFNTSYRFSTHIGVTLSKKWLIHTTSESGVLLSRFNKGFQSSLIKWIYRWKNL